MLRLQRSLLCCPQAPLNAVAADLELNTLDHRQMPLTWHLLPDPPVLRLEQLALRALRDRLASAALALRQVGVNPPIVWPAASVAAAAAAAAL